MSTEERIDALRSAAPNSWLAFSHDEDRVVGSAMTIREVTRLAEMAGETDPVITRIPSSWEPMVL
jgi:hypothetical protein